MKDILVHIGHPAHLHLFKHPIDIWKRSGKKVHVVLRDKDNTLELARRIGIEGECISTFRKGLVGGTLEMLEQDIRLFSIARKHDLLLVGTSIAITHMGRLLRLPSLLLSEDDEDVLGYISSFYFPFSTAIICPSGVRMGRYASKTLRYNSYQKLFYLHPNRFKPDNSIKKELGLSDSEPYAIIRLSALQAQHDGGIQGINEKT